MDRPPSQHDDLTALVRSADAYHELARELEAAGQAEAAEFGYAAAAALDLRNPELQASFGGPFNGQQERCRIVLDILAAIRPAAIVETGTFRGTTTEWLAARFDGPIYSCEIDRRFFLQAQEKLRRFDKVQISLADSRTFLRDLLPDLPIDRPVLFYLDAHWLEDLPLAEEMRLIVEKVPLAVIMIDDFRVPFDAGYAWDDYGPGKRISLDLLHAFKDCCSFAFPTLPAAEETGAKRGLCVMAVAESMRDILAMQPRLRQAEWREWCVVEAEVAAEIANQAHDRTVAQRDEAVAQRDEAVAQRDEAVAQRDEIVAMLAGTRERCEGLAKEPAGWDLQSNRLDDRLDAQHPHLLRHEVPRLGSNQQTPIACGVGDPEGLVRIVEEQASDLVRLRRALLAAKEVAAQRLDMISSVSEVSAQRLQTVSERACSMVREEISRVQDAISEVIERSRWRRAGQRFGVAKRLAWENQHWQTDLAWADSHPTPQIGQLTEELERLRRLLDELRRSRWRKLGQWLGVAKRFPWETGAWADPLLISPFPENAGLCPAAKTSLRTSQSSYSDFIEYANERFLEECRGFATDAIFDVGANTGQFAQGLRVSGYQGHIISFEPLSAAHGALTAAAACDPLWDVAERCAVGARDGWAEINIAGNSYSSSLLPMLDRHREAAPQSAYQGIEPCRVLTLDSYIERTFHDPTTVFGLKIDTQGFEAQVLGGIRRHHHRVKVIVCEMSVAPLYDQGPSMSELCHLLAGLGYRCVALGPEFEDPRNGELLQVNGVFVKRH